MADTGELKEVKNVLIGCWGCSVGCLFGGVWRTFSQ